MKRILVIPDSIWGNDSGHRSTQFLAKTLKKQGHQVGVFAEDVPGFSSQKERFLQSEGIDYFTKEPYRFFDQIFPKKKKAMEEFKELIEFFKPDLVFYFGTISNKVSIDYLNSERSDLPYIYLPLTNEFWCLKNFAGLKNGECYKCMDQNFTHAFINRCLDTNNPVPYIKGIIEKVLSRKRFLNANALLGYSKSQRKTFKMYGLEDVKAKSSNIFFEPAGLEGISSSKGDYFLISGQVSEAKGSHFVPKLIHSNATTNLRFKVIIYNENIAKKFIETNDLNDHINSGKLKVISGLDSHKDFLSYVANSLAVIITSNYPSTGEFALLEAMGLHKPVLAFDVGAHKDFLVDGENALVSPVSDLGKMIKDMQMLIEDPSLWKKLSANARATFEQVTYFDQHDSIIKSLNL
tara:strand:+ start:3083 stop:4303 length:1221 start_codon:yes stop_codon:yes gene_type:complete